MGLYNQLITVGTAQTIDLVSLGLFPTGTGFLLSTQSDGTPLPAGITITSAGVLTIANTATASGSIPLKITDGSTTIIYTVSLVAAASSTLNGDTSNNQLGVNGSGTQQIFGVEGADTLTGGSLADQLDGGDGNDSLVGNGGNDILDGDTGNDALIGGAGDDTYFVDSATDVITEAANGGADVVHSTAATYLLSAEVENLFLLGSSNINGTGNASANKIVGNTGNNILSGGTETTAAPDTLIGGLGDDTYIVGSGDVVTEVAGEGTDTVQSSVTYTLGTTLENLTLTGTTNIDATGNAGNNIITGNSGNNAINGGAGADQLIGGAGNDTYTVDNLGDVVTEAGGAGTDSVSSSVTLTLTVNVENLTLTGTAANGTGNDLANTITGNTAANTLNGGIGADTLIGGTGNDIYIVDNALDVVTETSIDTNEKDTVQSSITATLANFTNVENITLTGASAINATGNTLGNTLTGNSAANTLDGGTGADTLVGLGGNDIYVVDTTSDVVTEAASAGTDLVNSTVTYTLGSDVENLTLLTAGLGINGTGNTLANIITGNASANTLNSGTDALVDTLIGGAGDDIYVVGGTNDIVTEAASGGRDTIQSTVTYTIAALTNVENLTLLTGAVNGTGNAGNNVITGNDSANILDGGTGTDSLTGGIGNDTLNGGTDAVADTLVGGAGDDTYFVGDSDVVTEATSGGTDLVQSTANYTLGSEVENLTLIGTSAINGTGNALANVITGNSAANILDGGTANDTLVGGAGDDTYIFGTGDTITENSNAGTDTVSSAITVTLASFANVENITLTGSSTGVSATGNTGNNVINGASNTAANVLTGGAGNDTYIVGTGDTITENANEGTDTVSSDANVSLSSFANVENITLTGTTAINGTGNGLANIIIGNSAVNILDGGTGADNLTGGDGGDTYTVDNIGDVITELTTGTGTDLVNSSVTYTLSANVENLTLSGTAAINGTGNTSINTITGNSGDNILSGGNDAVVDTLSGGSGDDTYVVFSTLDTISDTAGNDTVSSALTVTLASFANVENITLTGSASGINATGNTGDNVLNGASNTAANILTGDAGNDTYIVGTGDTINDSAGNDTVSSAVTVNLSLFTGIENITLTGTATINATGNGSANTITGNGGFNILDGGGGADVINSGAGSNVIIGGTGADTLTGGAGANVFSYGTTRAGYTANLTDSLLGSVDTITGFTAADKFQAVVNPTTTVFTGGAVGTLDQAGIAAVLTTAAFTSYRAATFTFGGSTYVAINDANAGFSAATDAVINIGTTTAATITAANFVLPWA